MLIRSKLLVTLAGAGALAVAALGAARPAAAQITLLQPPDLTVSVSGPASVPAGTSATFQVTVRNVGLWRLVCFRDPVTRRFICEQRPDSSDAFGVRVDFALPGFTVTAPASPGAGFTCAGGASCTGGTLGPDDSITIPVTAVAGNTPGTFACNAVVDPTNAVLERDDANNTGSCSVAITPKPDLHVFGSVSPAPTFPQSSLVTFDMTVANLASGAANGVVIQMFTSLPAALSSWTIGAGFACNSPTAFGQRLQINCTGGSLAPFSTAPMRITLRLLNGTSPGFLPPNYPAGTAFSLLGLLDPGNAIPETNESDNTFMFVTSTQ